MNRFPDDHVLQHPPSRHQSGTSLIEILITVVLVSIGLLGLAGLQIMTVQNGNSSTERFEATTLARDILERMRANRQQAQAGSYDIALGVDPAVGGVAGDDLEAWRAALAGLPDGDGSVEVDAGVVTITVNWTDASDDNPDDTKDASVLLRTGL